MLGRSDGGMDVGMGTDVDRILLCVVGRVLEGGCGDLDKRNVPPKSKTNMRIPIHVL